MNFDKELPKQIKPYVFYKDNLSAYEKTIYVLAIAYGACPIYKLSKEDIEELSMFLEVDFELLEKALENNYIFPYENAVITIGEDTIECGDYFKNDFFDVIVKIFFAYKNLDELLVEVDSESVCKNIEIFRAINHCFEMANTIVSTYECMYKNYFSYDNLMYDSIDHFYPKSYVDMLLLLETSRDCSEYDEELLRIIVVLLKYEFRSRINALYLVTICQIFKHSPCYTPIMKNIATDLYNKLLCILKNGRVISININCLYRNVLKPALERTKKDNTTRMQILYGFSNYDCYDLRIDFSHKGQEVVHFNNQTPGGLACCILDKYEYQDIISKYPELKDCFISYEDRWALKERANCELTNDILVAFEKVRKEKSHAPVFTKEYSEEEINSFIDDISKMLPKNCRKALDTDGSNAKCCFNYDVLMRDTTYLYSAYLSRDSALTDIIGDRIAKRAFSYGLTSEKTKIDTFGQLVEIIKLAEEKVY